MAKALGNARKSAKVVKPEGLTGRPIPSGGGKNKLHEVSTAKKNQRERLKEKKETDKTQTMPWQIVTVPNSLCLLSWGETCCFVQYSCIGPYRATLKKNIQVPQELSLWLQLKDTSPAMPQHCVFYSGSALLWFLRVPLWAGASITCITDLLFWGPGHTCCKLSHKENYSIQMVLSSWYVQP